MVEVEINIEIVVEMEVDKGIKIPVQVHIVSEVEIEGDTSQAKKQTGAKQTCSYRVFAARPKPPGDGKYTISN